MPPLAQELDHDHAHPSPDTDELDSDPSDESSPACILVFNASDPSGAGGLTGDIATIASVGGHAIAVVTGAYARDTAQIFDHFCLDDEAVAEQARAVLEDLPLCSHQSGLCGQPREHQHHCRDRHRLRRCARHRLHAQPSWWREELIDEYLDAFRELLLPQTSVLVGNHSTLWRWLLPDWSSDRSPTARDIARAASGDGRALHPGHRHPTARAVCRERARLAPDILGSGKFELFDATFSAQATPCRPRSRPGGQRQRPG